VAGVVLLYIERTNNDNYKVCGDGEIGRMTAFWAAGYYTWLFASGYVVLCMEASLWRAIGPLMCCRPNIHMLLTGADYTLVRRRAPSSVMSACSALSCIPLRILSHA